MAKNRISLTNEIINAAQPDPRGKSPVLIGDGNGLYLQITTQGIKSYIFRYTINKKTRAMGLGPVRMHSLAAVRRLARELRVQVDKGIDPLQERTIEAAAKNGRSNGLNFRECAEAYLATTHGPEPSKKNEMQWRNTVVQYAYPVIGDLAVHEITVKDVVAVLEPQWRRIPETASRLRARLERIFGYATAMGYRPANSSNPAKWSGAVGEVLPSKSKVSEVKHHNSLPHSQIPEFMKRIRDDGSMGSLLTQFIILTMSRTGEARAAVWDEVDLENNIWVVPATRMKGAREHHVPLSSAAVTLLKFAKGNNEQISGKSRYVFPGRKDNTCLSSAASAEFLKRINRTDISVHGFRSTARMWAAECTEYPREVCESALAHKLRDRVEAAYMRSTFLDKRRDLMEAWGRFCTS